MNTPALFQAILAVSRHSMLMILLAGAAFGADELKESPPTGSEPGTVQTSSDFAKGWSVVRVAIPSTGNISHAFVDLKSPAGRVLTLSDGVMSKEGVTLEKVEWSGSPVRAKVVLHKGQERAELYADASLVARDDALRRREPVVEIEAKFIEIPNESVAKVLSLEGDENAMVISPTDAEALLVRIREDLGLAYYVGSSQVAELARRLNQAKGVDLLSGPRVTTKSQQRAVIEIIREFRHPTAWNPPDAKNKHWTPSNFETTNVGVTVEVEPTVNDDDTLGLLIRPQVVEFLGFIDHVTKKPLAKAEQDPKAKGLADREIRIDVNAKLSEAYGPVFSKRGTVADLVIYSGQTVILRLHETGPTDPFPSPSADKALFAFDHRAPSGFRERGGSKPRRHARARSHPGRRRPRVPRQASAEQARLRDQPARSRRRLHRRARLPLRHGSEMPLHRENVPRAMKCVASGLPTTG